MRDMIAALTRNAISLAGVALAMVSGILFVTLLAIEILGVEGHAYVGIITYLILPAIFLLGLVLIPWGIARERKRAAVTAFPVIDLNLDSTRKRLLTFLGLVVVSVVILATATFKGVEFMESNTFCGTSCHSVMAPEYTAYRRSPHARVPCVKCHVGSGTSWFVRSKLSGAWQMVSTVFDLYSRPIPTPVHNLRPSKGTCEQCHWPSKFIGVRPKMITRYSEDEENTELKTILLLKVGGHDFDRFQGIHWHMDPDIRIRYRADESREEIYEVELTEEDGTVKLFRSSNAAEGGARWRIMDCIDCHNRPTHIYYGAGEVVDLMLERGFIAPDLPFVRREGKRTIHADYASHEEAKTTIAADLAAYYQAEYPELAASRAADIERAGEVLGAAYASNVFPSMNLGWDTYPDHIGHERSPGCFRCHGGPQSTDDGDSISDDCTICHTIVAYDEASPEILELIPKD